VTLVFGYVVPYKPELKVRDYEYYKAVYCGICLQTKKIGNLPRVFLNYDFVFLYLVLKEHFKVKDELGKTRCIVHPIKERFFLKPNEILEYVSNQMVLLSFFKLYDNILDEKNIFSYAPYSILKLYVRKITKSHREPFEKIKELFNKQISLEKSGCENIDELAHNFGNILAEIFAYNDEELLRQIGYYTGVWVYIIDAIDDYIDDVKKKRYNCLKHHFEKCRHDKRQFEYELSILKVSLENYLAILSDYIKGYNNSILNNIVRVGMYSKTQQVLEHFTTNFFKELKK